MGQEPRREQPRRHHGQRQRIRPRIGIIYDPTGQGLWSVTASFAKYIAAIANSIGDSSSNAGNTATYSWAYAGPQINANANAATLVASPAAIQTVFDWCRADSRGFCTGIPMSGASVPGVSVTIPERARLAERPGVFRRRRAPDHRRIDARADFTYRDFAISTRSGSIRRPESRWTRSATDRTSRWSKHQQLEAPVFRPDCGRPTACRRERTWAPTTRCRSCGATSTARTLNSGRARIVRYPEYRDPAWNFPEGDLSSDQRHRTSMWGDYGVPKVDGLTLSVLQTIASGVPYGAVGQVDTAPFVTNPGYLTPQGSLGTVNYYFTARDAFRTGIGERTDCRPRTVTRSSPRAAGTSICSSRLSWSTRSTRSTSAAAAAPPYS